MFVSGAILLKVFQLEIQGFLHAENQRILVLDHGNGRIPAIGPDVVSVIGRAVTDVIGHNFNSGRFLLAGNQKGQKRRQNEG